MPDPQEVVIVDNSGVEHVFPAGMDPKKAAGIVRYRTQAHPPSAEDFAPKAEGTGVVGALKAFGSALDPRPLASAVADMYQASRGDPFAAERTGERGKGIIKGQLRQFGKVAEDVKRGRYSEAIGHSAAGVLPLVGPAAAHAGERIGSGDIAGGIGESAAVLAPFAVPAAAGAIGGGGQKVARNLYMRSLKPTKAVLEDAPAFRTGGQAAARTEMARTGLENRIPVGGARGVEKAGGLIENINEKIADRIAQSDLAGRHIDPAQVAKRAQEIKAKFANQVTPQSDLAAIDQAITDFMAHPSFGATGGAASLLAPSEAQAMKQGTYRTLKGKVYGELKSADTEAQKALARGLKEEIATVAPEVGPLNLEESQLINLQKALQDRARTAGNADPLKLTEAVLAASGSPKRALFGLINRPAILSRGAIGLNTASTGLQNAPAAFRTALLAALGLGQQEEQP